MAIFADNVAETVSNNPTFPVTLSGAIAGYRSFATAYGADCVDIPLVLRKSDGTSWMTFVGSFTSSTNTISYSSMRASSSGSQVVPTSGIWSLSVDLLADEADKIITLPQNLQSANYTCVLADAGKQITHSSSDNNARTFTIPANSSVAYKTGTVLTFINLVNTLSIAITTDTLTLANSTSTGTRTLAVNGIATAIKVGSTSWLISGIGLT